MMASVDVEREMEGLFGDTDQTEQENATQSLTQEEAEQREGGGANLDVTGAEDAKKKRVIRPQPKLDPDRLMGPRGLLALEEAFVDWQPRGKGREFDDLDVVMKKMEHWAHRLFPSLPFDQVLEKIAGPLGKKKTLQCHVKKIRLGMVSNDTVHVGRDEEKVVEEEKEEDDVQRYDGGGGGDVDERDEFEEMLRRAGGEMPPPVVQVPPRPKPAGLTQEQKEKIKKNREMAENKRKERLAAAAAADMVQDRIAASTPVDDRREDVRMEASTPVHDRREDGSGDSQDKEESEKEKSADKENEEILNLDEMMDEMDEGDSNLVSGSSVEPEKEKGASKETMNLEEMEADKDSLVIENSVEAEKEKSASEETMNLDEMMEEMDAD